jgi:hypothetical protein
MNNQQKINPWNIKSQHQNDAGHDYLVTFDDQSVAAISVKKLNDNRIYTISRIDGVEGLTEFNKNWLDVVLESIVQIDEYLQCDRIPYKLIEFISLMKLMPDKGDIDGSDILESSKKLVPPFLVERRKAIKNLPEITDGCVQSQSAVGVLP